MAKPCHHIGGGCLKNLSAGPDERNDSVGRFDPVDPFRGYDQPNNIAAFWINRRYVRSSSQDFWDEQAIPRAPRRKLTTVHLETMVHPHRRESAETKDTSLAIGVGEALD